MQRCIVSQVPRGAEARRTAVIVPTRSAAEQLRRTFENLTLGDGSASACIVPDLLTRADLYGRLHQRLPDASPLLTEFEREVLLRLAGEDAQREGAVPPFRLRPGLIAAILSFYDELRRRGRTIDSLDRHVRAPLEGVSDSDRGAARLLEQTTFLSTAFAAFERRVADSGRLDEHALRAMLLANETSPPYRHVVVAVADQAADPRGLWPADFDLLSRIGGLERLDVIATERLLESGWHQRLHDALPEIEEQRAAGERAAPVLLVPAVASNDEQPAHFVLRDREEELAAAARWIKHSAREAVPGAPLDRMAIVFQRPLPYLYLARQVFPSARVPYQAMDALPLAAEPFAAALDLLFAAALEDGSRTTLIELMASPHWRFVDAVQPDVEISRRHVSALDRVLRESKYLGGWDRLQSLAELAEEKMAAASRDSARWRRASPALRAAAALGPALQLLFTATTASAQLREILRFVATFGRVAGSADAGAERQMRARAAILGALSSLADAHAQFDDRPVPVVELVATVRRWIEGQTFAPRTGEAGVLLLDAPAAAFADVDAVRLVGLVEADWPERTTVSIFYPTSLLRELGWPPESARLAAARARFQDLLTLAGTETSVSAFTLEDDALVSPSPFLEDVSAAGLVVRHRPSAPANRVFTHEALSHAPLAREAIVGPPAEWLELRLARTAAIDPRYHGAVGSRADEIYAVSRVERYLECPFKYFAGHVLRLDEEREDESGLTPLERGQLLHGVFEAFFVAWRERGHGAVTIANLADAVALFETVAETHLLDLPEADRALERTYLLGSAASPGLAERAFAFEIEQGVAVVERLLEFPLEGRFPFNTEDGARELRIRGKADRIDLLADGTLRIVDYKLGRAPKPARALQLPVYGVCAAHQLEGRHGRHWSVGRAGYLAFREKNAFVDVAGRSGNLDAALREGELRFTGAIGRIEAGEFPPSPDEAWTCTRCGFSDVCRKDYVGDE